MRFMSAEQLNNCQIILGPGISTTRRAGHAQLNPWYHRYVHLGLGTRLPVVITGRGRSNVGSGFNYSAGVISRFTLYYKTQTNTQYPVAAPCNSITLGITFLKCLMYLLHFSLSTVLQNVVMPSTSSCLHFGLISLRMNSFNSCHKFSIGLQSGDSGGVCHQLMLLFSMKDFAILDVCLGSLSCMNLCPSG